MRDQLLVVGRQEESEILRQLVEMPFFDFDQSIEILYQLLGYKRINLRRPLEQQTARLILSDARERKWVVMCQRWSGAQGEKLVTGLISIMMAVPDTFGGAAITTGYFNDEAKRIAQEYPQIIRLYNGPTVARTILEQMRRAEEEELKRGNLPPYPR